MQCLDGRSVAVVKPWSLRWYLDKAVPKRLLDLLGDTTLQRQIPDARITSPPHAWLAKKELPANHRNKFIIAANSRHLLHEREADVAFSLDSIAYACSSEHDEVSHIENTVSALKVETFPFEGVHFETKCGFKVQGGDLIECYHPSAECYLDGPDSAVIQPRRPVSVLLRFANGTGTILPDIPEFITGLTFKEGNLVDVVYEPTGTSARWRDYQPNRDYHQKLRGKLAEETRSGIFDTIGSDADALAEFMQPIKSMEPTLAIYAAYAYYNLQSTAWIRKMEDYLADDLRLRIFDIALLGGTLHEQGRPDGGRWNDTVCLSTPLLSQGWALFSAKKVQLPTTLRNLPSTLTDSLWSMFAPEGVEMLRTALKKGEII